MTPPRFEVPEGYEPERVTDDLSDMVMRVLLAAYRAGKLDEVFGAVEAAVKTLTGREDD